MKKIPIVLMMLIWVSLNGFGQNGIASNKYHSPSEIHQQLLDIQQANRNVSGLHLIGHSFSGQPVHLIEIGPETTAEKKSIPAVFVAANFEGINPLASEAAIYLIKDLLKNPDKYENLTWYILPVGNPEGASHFFSSPKMVNSRNLRPYNDDMDDQVDEDGNEDLNGDGFITKMRVKDPSGTMIIDSTDARRMRSAKYADGEKGIYKVYSEGIDNDNDGKYNEDRKGGTNNGISFPHLFKYNGVESGKWAGQEDEVFGIMEFMIDHPQIALVMHYGSTNFCMQAPKGGRKGGTNLTSLRIPKNYVSMLNADANKRYTMAEVKEMVKAVVPPGMVVDDSMIAGMLGLGPAVNPLTKDLTIYNNYSKEYKKFLKEKGYSTDRLDPKAAKDGSFELWAYYHLGLPSFSQDFWGVPKLTPEKPDSTAKAKKPEQQAKTGKPGENTSGKKPGKIDAEKIFLKYNDSLLNGEAFVKWAPYNHPQLGEVEIGGRVPFADFVPPPEEIEKAITAQVPWIYELTKGIPKLNLDAKKIKDIGDGIYKLEVWITNAGKYHFPLAMGSKNKVPAPAVITLKADGLEFLQGKDRTPIASIEAGKKQKFSWLLRSKNTEEIELSIRAVNARGSESTINLGGTK